MTSRRKNCKVLILSFCLSLSLEHLEVHAYAPHSQDGQLATLLRDLGARQYPVIGQFTPSTEASWDDIKKELHDEQFSVMFQDMVLFHNYLLLANTRAHRILICQDMTLFHDYLLLANTRAHHILICQMAYIWTDKRLQVLVRTFHEHVNSQNMCHSHIQLLHSLVVSLLDLTDKEAKDCPRAEDISKKLTELAECYENKGVSSSYCHLKERLGRDTCRLFRSLVRHQRFNEYLPPDAMPRRVTDPKSVELSMSGSEIFCWIDRRLQLLVTSYYNYLLELDCEKGTSTTEKNGKACLAALKKRLGWKITNQVLEFKLYKIFSDFADLRNDYRAFRIRIGKEVRKSFDCLVKHPNYKLFEKKDMTSSGTSSSKRRRMSLADQDRAESVAAMDQVTSELAELEFNEIQCGIAAAMLTDLYRRSGFWACKNRKMRKAFVLHILGEG